MTSSLIAEQLKQMPACPGVYLMKDAVGSILYVGKAASLRNRVRSYFAPAEKLTPKIQRMVSRVHDIDFFVTNTDQEALILELNLIKRHRPHFNVRLKDDKTFPFLKITLNEEWPRVYFTRRVAEDGGRYFGPFASARSVRETLKVLRRIFPFRTCTRPIDGADSRACLEYHMGQCVGPCIGAVSREEYAKVIKQVILFLEGRSEAVLRQLKARMQAAAESLDFEKAAVLRDQVQAIEQVIEGQRIAATVSGEQDAIAFTAERDIAYVQVFFIRSAKLIGRESFVLQGANSEEPEQIMSGFIKQFYSSATYIPPLLALQHPVEDRATIEAWLQSKKGSKVRLLVPRRGSKKQLVDIVAANAEQGLRLMKLKQQLAHPDSAVTLAEIQQELRLPRPPERMECYDISNIQGKLAVGSMVVFEKGKPKPAHYRRFRIKTIGGADDYAMLQEVLRRRFKRGREGEVSWAVVPDLVLIDGGKGQLNMALAAMKEVGAGDVPVASLAKEREEIFVPERAGPIALPASSPARQMLQHLRDEAHRFALGYHISIRQKASLTSALDSVPGIGPRRKRALLRKFGSVRGIREATAEELAAAPGMTGTLAKKVKEYL
ncbi:MAG: excinuclease ABC subunit UvrC [Chloroflexi bacterium]|nr:excinuclease ABC subunit UvrC [Chloroflexota bacterium]